jgi:hypothetical protein
MTSVQVNIYQIAMPKIGAKVLVQKGDLHCCLMVFNYLVW